MMRFWISWKKKLEVFPKSMEKLRGKKTAKHSTIFSPNPLHPVNHQILLASLLWSLWVAPSLVHRWIWGMLWFRNPQVWSVSLDTVPTLKLTVCTWKLMVGRPVSFWVSAFLGRVILHKHYSNAGWGISTPGIQSHNVGQVPKIPRLLVEQNLKRAETHGTSISPCRVFARNWEEKNIFT